MAAVAVGVEVVKLEDVDELSDDVDGSGWRVEGPQSVD